MANANAKEKMMLETICVLRRAARKREGIEEIMNTNMNMPRSSGIEI